MEYLVAAPLIDHETATHEATIYLRGPEDEIRMLLELMEQSFQGLAMTEMAE